MKMQANTTSRIHFQTRIYADLHCFWQNMQMVRGLAAYALRSALHYINHFWERTYAHAHTSFHLDLFNPWKPCNPRLQIAGKSVNHFDWIIQNKANLPAAQDERKLRFDKGL
jgi:hypothetical protein